MNYDIQQSKKQKPTLPQNNNSENQSCEDFEFQSQEDLVFTKDEEGCSNILYVENYWEKVNKELNNEIYYKKINKNPTQEYTKVSKTQLKHFSGNKI